MRDDDHHLGRITSTWREAKGLKSQTIFWHYALRNAASASGDLSGYIAGSVMSGAVLVEVILAIRVWEISSSSPSPGTTTFIQGSRCSSSCRSALCYW
jgi:hypothetical protein